MQPRQPSCPWCLRATRRAPHNCRDKVAFTPNRHAKRTQKRARKRAFWVDDGFTEIHATLLERMAGTTRLELAAGAARGRDPTDLGGRSCPSLTPVVSDPRRFILSLYTRLPQRMLHERI